MAIKPKTKAYAHFREQLLQRFTGGRAVARATGVLSQAEYDEVLKRWTKAGFTAAELARAIEIAGRASKVSAQDLRTSLTRLASRKRAANTRTCENCRHWLKPGTGCIFGECLCIHRRETLVLTSFNGTCCRFAAKSPSESVINAQGKRR